MKLPINKHVYSSIALLVLTGSAFAHHHGSTSQKVYLGIFGGGASTESFNVTQFGTAFYTEAAGGPLAVNAFGDTSSRSTGFFGVQLGYQAHEMMLHPRLPWTLSPAVEMEAYSFSNKTFNADLINNTARLPEHDFVVSYPMSRNVFLANAVLNFNHPCFLLHPYVGFGIGGAVLRISGADASQIAPPEVGINHYNANDSDTNPTFAGQIKAGLSYDVNKWVSLFLEYRWLYLSSTHYAFGSTVYPTHVVTSNWQVKMDPQRTNMGSIGIRFNV
jgi:opacity protein-like surface antigen